LSEVNNGGYPTTGALTTSIRQLWARNSRYRVFMTVLPLRNSADNYCCNTPCNNS
jgi:hypothetical protein